jgi:hypothetical protein
LTSSRSSSDRLDAEQLLLVGLVGHRDRVLEERRHLVLRLVAAELHPQVVALRELSLYTPQIGGGLLA